MTRLTDEEPMITTHLAEKQPSNTPGPSPTPFPAQRETPPRLPADRAHAAATQARPLSTLLHLFLAHPFRREAASRELTREPTSTLQPPGSTKESPAHPWPPGTPTALRAPPHTAEYQTNQGRVPGTSQKRGARRTDTQRRRHATTEDP